MVKLQYNIQIDAPRKKVWQVMLGKDTYPKWASVFEPGSDYEGSWEKGTEMRFFAAGTPGWMRSTIAENRPFEFVSLQHQGFVEDGKVEPPSEIDQVWQSAYENYTFRDKDGGTEVQVDMNMPDKDVDMIDKLWPKALEALKDLCEE